MTEPKIATYQSGQVYKRLMGIVRPFIGILLLGILGNMVYGLVDASFTYVLKPILDKGFIAKDMSFIRMLPVIIIGLFLLRGIANFTANYFMHRAGREVIYQFRWRTFQHLMKLPMHFYAKKSRGTLLSTIIYNAEQVSSAGTEALTSVVQSGFTVLGLLTVMLMNSWRLTLIFLLIAPIISVIIKFASRRMRQISHQIQGSVGEVTAIAQEALENYQVIRIFGGESYEKGKFAKAIRNNFRQELRLIVTRVLSSSTVQIVTASVLAFIIYMVTAPSSFLNVTAGSFVSMVGAMFAMLKPMKDLTTVTGKIQRGLAGAQSIFELLDSDLEPDTGTKALQQVQGEISLQAVSFSYPDSDISVLRDVSFTANAKQTIAIVGRSGSGKSTLVSLLPRFCEIAAGQIRLDGVDTRELCLANLRQHFALVSQQVTLFNDTIAHNIAYGALNTADRQSIVTVAKQAHAMEFIEQLPQGLDTIVGENGVMLSGGQRQRIAIARALLKNAPILVLDEATSALDNESEYYIQLALEQLMQQRTTFVIAHRLSTIEKADQIIVLDQGRVVEQGTHQQLLQLRGHYARLHAMQFKEETSCEPVVS